MSLNDPPAFQALFTRLTDSFKTGSLRKFENDEIPERGRALFELWRNFVRDMAARWREVDPKTRVQWAGPEMSVRSSMTARQMETWAHGQEIFDLFGDERQEGDRIRNIVVLGINTFGWTFKVHGLPQPEKMPFVELLAPSGETWTYGEKQGDEVIHGSAVEFCQVVTQTRNIEDTALRYKGETATLWMKNAQCFAGPPETPPPPGTRKKAAA